MGDGRVDCIVQLLVDGVQRDLYEGSGDDRVQVTVNGDGIDVLYPESGFKTSINFSYWNGCIIDACFHVPDCDNIIGLLGTPDNDASNDWVNPDGSFREVPASKKERGRHSTSYNYCQDAWCIRNEGDSIFTYNQDGKFELTLGFLRSVSNVSPTGIDFEDFEFCDLPYGVKLQSYIEEQITPEIVEVCSDDSNCIFDAVTSGLDSARKGMEMRSKELKDTCRPKGGECFNTGCCEPYVCKRNFGGITGRVCYDPNEAAGQVSCTLEADMCGNGSPPCCDGLMCMERSNGLSFCDAPPPACYPERTQCFSDDECCDGNKCAGPEGDKLCLNLPAEDGVLKLPVNEECGYGIDCVSGATCVDFDGLKTCQILPQCWDKELRNCNPDDGMPGCCDGLACLPFGDEGRLLCQIAA